MAIITLRQLLDHAGEYGYGMPAFNITNLETMQAVLTAADRTGSPVLLQASRSARKHMDDTFLKHMFIAAAERYPHLPMCLHLDHGNEMRTCMSAIDLGFTSVMMDGSLREDAKTPSDYAYNVRTTSAVVEVAHARGVSVEGELGVLGSLETGMGEKEDGHGFDGKLDKSRLLTDPAEARAFVAATGVDALAVAIGTSHGAYKFSRRPTGDILAMEVIEAIHAELPNTHLVMHGASTISPDLQALINEHGGNIPKTFGVPLEEVERGIRSGVRKINIDTDNRMAMTGSMRKYLRENHASFDIRSALSPGRERSVALCMERNERFGAAGMAQRIKPISLPQMADRYLAGMLRLQVA
ncbi:MAG: fructose-bisphosphate aldolase class II [Alphaproteobacteria bacterium]|nr:fructose-bisphosphate aldolase class II [Alphaproteobacteria bacterium]